MLFMKVNPYYVKDIRNITNCTLQKILTFAWSGREIKFYLTRSLLREIIIKPSSDITLFFPPTGNGSLKSPAATIL